MFSGPIAVCRMRYGPAEVFETYSVATKNGSRAAMDEKVASSAPQRPIRHACASDCGQRDRVPASGEVDESDEESAADGERPEDQDRRGGAGDLTRHGADRDGSQRDGVRDQRADALLATQEHRPQAVLGQQDRAAQGQHREPLDQFGSVAGDEDHHAQGHDDEGDASAPAW